MRKFTPLLFLVGLVQGCATSPPTSAAVTALPSCCKSLAEAQYRTLPLESKTTVRISATSPVFEFPEGKSHFAAFEIADSGQVRALDIEMDLSVIWLPSATIFLPNLVFLDKEKLVTRFLSELQVRQAHDFWTGDNYFARVPVRPGERFVVVYTDPHLVGQTVPFNNGGSGYVFMSGKIPIYVPGEASTHQLGRNTVGSLSLKTRH